MTLPEGPSAARPAAPGPERWLPCDGPVVPLSGPGRVRWRESRGARRRTMTMTWLDGREPVDLGSFRDAVERAERRAGPGTRVEHALCTTGARLDDTWCRFLAARDFLVGLSADDTAGRRLLPETARRLRLHGVDCNVLYRVHAGNADDPVGVYRYCRDELGVRHVQFIPVVERVGEARRAGRRRAGGSAVSARTVRPEQWAAFLVAVFDEWVRRDVGRQHVQIFEEALTAWTAAARRPRTARAGWERLPLYCRCCPVLFACGGGSPGNRFVESPDGEPGLAYLCAGYREFFDHIDQPMQVMAALLRSGRDVAEVMTVIARYEHERRAASDVSDA
ncbi:hypothetical protein [Actinomadura bangladeshensis]|uniref:Radical SAM protein n=1 Tax=Actinomadura bangladeshensis TaxID=453573 RepID=A0A6L9QW00_9ACTN|nr:hypothetical protein [Actinomadura bangladeshensis]NEA29689.1 hypothetical protein [Actinomadura bangladeshensis]